MLTLERVFLKSYITRKCTQHTVKTKNCSKPWPGPCSTVSKDRQISHDNRASLIRWWQFIIRSHVYLRLFSPIHSCTNSNFGDVEVGSEFYMTSSSKKVEGKEIMFWASCPTHRGDCGRTVAGSIVGLLTRSRDPLQPQGLLLSNEIVEVKILLVKMFPSHLKNNILLPHLAELLTQLLDLGHGGVHLTSAGIRLWIISKSYWWKEQNK